eukprot:XP_001609566.1 variant erythrocyte surface antigen-1, beta subunit [Babesia bovis T2Bo]
MAPETWKPHESLTQAPTNLKEAIDWVLRVTGRDGKNNDKAASPPQFGCLCFLAKAIKDLLYDARSPGTPGPSPERNWDGILLDQEKDIVLPVLTDLGLVNSDSTSASTTSSCAGGTEVIGTLIEQLALGLQKWVGWQEGDTCCLKGTDGIGKECKCPAGVGGQCCTGAGGTTCHDCTKCGTGASSGSADKKCYQSAYCKTKSSSSSGSSSAENYLWPTLSEKPVEVHLLARIFLGSVCLIWSGLSQLGFLTGGKSDERWSQSKLHEIEGANVGLGSFMAAMGYDLDRLNQGVPAQSAAKGSSKSTESICKEYPLLVLHILASGYFRAGSAGANKVTPASPATPKKDETPSPRKPRTIREILYWLSALPYSQGYKALVGRMKDKYPPKDGKPQETVEQIELYNDSDGSASTTLQRKDITHYLMAACGYCPLVLIGIQGTIEREVKTETQPAPAGAVSPAAAAKNTCPKHKEKPHERCKLEKSANTDTTKAQSSTSELKEGEVCYGGYHLEVSKFGPLHGMYANGLFGFQMDGSAAQCLDQLRVYVYHCFYQLYFLRKQCSTGVEVGGVGGAKTVLGWQSCRYGSGVNPSGGVKNSHPWLCETKSGTDCQCKTVSGKDSPLMLFLCDGIGSMVCKRTVERTPDSDTNTYPEIIEHINTKDDNPKGHFDPPLLKFPQICPVPMGWQSESKYGHFKGQGTYPVHCTGNTLSHLLEYYCDPSRCHGSLVVLLRLLACITPTVPRTLGDLFGFYYYVVYIGSYRRWDFKIKGVREALGKEVKELSLYMDGNDDGDNTGVIKALKAWNKEGTCEKDSHTGVNEGSLKTLYGCTKGTGQCCPYLSPLSGQQYGQLSPLMAGTYLSWLVYLIEGFRTGLEGLKGEFQGIDCKDSECHNGAVGGAAGCGADCKQGSHGTTCSSGSGSGGVCKCASVVSCTGVLPVLYKYGFGYGNVEKLHNGPGPKKCDAFLTTLNKVLEGEHLKTGGSNTGLHHEINKLIYTTRLPWIFVLTVAWLMAVLYLAFGAIWPLDWTHMRSHCRGWFRKGSLSPWEVLMVGKKKGRGILEFFGKT